ncbi:tyrosine-protein phosphatase [Bailinhaonella thermotolerans]|uniref:tyrosine-protein phosphatase n=1 Tax=Bailinhaonella thermotolerans TaxID=1070861 RepID=UPI001F5BEEBA|nr:tyrosine-protein phosphatase [Bailinhaonella thermotolerans]
MNLEGAVNVRDLGGLPTDDGGETRFGRVLRSDNLQGLTAADVRRLVGELKLRHVVDLRSGAEVSLEGPGPLVSVPEVTIHHLTLFAEAGTFTDVEAAETEVTEAGAAGAAGVDGDLVLPWQNRAPEDFEHAGGFYMTYLRDRPDSVVRALRVLGGHEGEGAALVHCAAGKDRTGVVVALALTVAGVTREAVVDDYVRTGDRMSEILARLRASPTYTQDLDGRPDDSHLPHGRMMERFLSALDEGWGGPVGWLEAHGWTAADSAALRARLRD